MCGYGCVAYGCFFFVCFFFSAISYVLVSHVMGFDFAFATCFLLRFSRDGDCTAQPCYCRQDYADISTTAAAAASLACLLML